MLDELHDQLLALDAREEELHLERAAVMRSFVRAAGGLTEAAGLLQLDPRTVVQIQRLDDLAMVVYRGPGAAVDANGRPYKETGAGDASAVQREADQKWWRVARTSRPKIRLLVVVDQGSVRRIWPVRPESNWREKDGKVALPLGPRPLTPAEVAERYPNLGFGIGDERPMRQGKLREYLPIDGPAERSGTKR